MDIRKTRLYAESWNIAYRLKSQGAILNNLEEPFIVIPNPMRYWAADPMVYCVGDTTYLFAELFEYSSSTGVIGVCEFTGNGFSDWKVIIKEKTHLSYPFVFQHNGKHYMLPESSTSNCVPLYVATEFPYKWEKLKNLAEDVAWVDTTLYKTESGYIGYTETRSIPPVDYRLLVNNDLELVSKETILHSGDSKHRCGGRIFESDGVRIVVTQDCTTGYGAALFFRKLNDEMEEIESIRVSPECIRIDRPLLKDGIHTYTATHEMEVIDIKTVRFSLYNFFYRLLGKVKMFLRGWRMK